MDTSSAFSARRRSCWGVYETALLPERLCVFPERFRSFLGEELALVRLPSHAIGVFPSATVELWGEAPRSGEALRDLPGWRLLLADAEFENFDAKGRLSLSAKLCAWAALSPATPLRIVGVGASVEIWSQSEWERYEEGVLLRDREGRNG